jgi:TetR/AcrR family transcriptional regulator, cholesterol catabolism regulator
MDNRERILQEARLLFEQHGMKRITMDDIARELSVSKKTLYQYFKDKEELVMSVAKIYIIEQEQQMNAIRRKSKNAVEEIALMMECLSEMFTKTNPELFYDCRKYYPDAWHLFFNHKENYIITKVTDNLRWGKREGYYRSDIDVDILSRLRLEQVKDCMDISVFPSSKFDFKTVHIECFRHFMHGIMSPKGLQFLQKYLKKKNKPVLV